MNQPSALSGCSIDHGLNLASAHIIISSRISLEIDERSIRLIALDKFRQCDCEQETGLTRPTKLKGGAIKFAEYTYAQLVLEVVLLGGQLGVALLEVLQLTLLAGQRVQQGGLLGQQFGVQGLKLLAYLNLSGMKFLSLLGLLLQTL